MPALPTHTVLAWPSLTHTPSIAPYCPRWLLTPQLGIQGSRLVPCLSSPLYPHALNPLNVTILQTYDHPLWVLSCHWFFSEYPPWPLWHLLTASLALKVNFFFFLVSGHTAQHGGGGGVLDLQPGIEPLSPELEGGVLTTGPSGKPLPP